MRELNECTAEVFRRSEQRIRERRRKRSCVLALCIPACLIVTVWSTAVLPSMMPDLHADYSQAEGEMAGSAPESPFCPYAAVEIQAAGVFPEEHDGKVTDRLTVAEIFDAVNSFFADADGNNRDGSGNLQNSDNLPAAEDNAGDCQSEPASTDRRKDCTITFTAENGLQAVYHLSGNALVNVSTNETVFLSEDQTAGLLAVLGLAE